MYVQGVNGVCRVSVVQVRVAQVCVGCQRCCSVVALCCSVLQYVAVCSTGLRRMSEVCVGYQ